MCLWPGLGEVQEDFWQAWEGGDGGLVFGGCTCGGDVVESIEHGSFFF